MEPILFRPFLAMIASHIAPPEGSVSRKRKLLLALLLAEFFALGALNHALSASHWRWNDARNPLLHLGLTEEDRELVNAIYGQPRAYKYEYVASIFSWAAPSAQLVHASGALLFPRSLGDLLNNASSKEELAMIVSALPTPFILVPLKELPPDSPLVNATKGLEVVFSNSKYVLVSSSQLSPIGSKYNLTEFIAVSGISFNGSACIRDERATITLLDVVNGALLPREGGYVKIITSSNVTTALNPVVEIRGDIIFHSFRATRGYASLLGSSSAEKLELRMEEVKFKVYASFRGERMYIGDFSTERSRTTPWFTVRPVRAKWMLEAYIDRNYVDSLAVATSAPGKVVTLIFALWALLTFRKRLSRLPFGLLRKH